MLGFSLLQKWFRTALMALSLLFAARSEVDYSLHAITYRGLKAASHHIGARRPGDESHWSIWIAVPA